MPEEAEERQEEINTVSVIIPARNEAGYLAACLSSVLAQQWPGLEIIVVDNGSTDTTAAIAAHMGTRVVFEPRAGLPMARNAGWRAAHGEILVYLDADTTIPPGFIAAYLQALRAHPQAVAVSSIFHFADGSRLLNSVQACSFVFNRLLARLHVAPFLVGANFAIRRDALARIGGFNIALTFYGEDTDLAKRLAPLGPILFLTSPCSTTSARRYRRQGLLRTLAVSLVNYFAVLWSRRVAVG